MTNFDPNSGFKDIEQWEMIAERKASNTGMAAKIIGGVLVGGAGIAFGVEILGGIAAAWCVKSAWDSFDGIGKRLRLVRDCGCNAFLLSEDEFRTYVKQFGDETVYQELTFAKDAGAELTPFAENWLRTSSKELTSSSSEQLSLTQSVTQSAQQPIVIPVPPSSTSDHQWIESVLKLPFRIITGGQGSGKSTLERFMISQLKKAGYHIIIINPETNPDTWQGVEVLSTPEEITEFMDEFPNEVRNRQIEARDKGIDEDEYFDFLVKEGRTGRDGRVAIFFQESNTYEVHGVDSYAIADTFKQCLTNIRKWGYIACLTAHSGNQTSISSKLKGYSHLIEQQPLIECISTNDPKTGLAVSSGKEFLKLKGAKDSNPKTIKLVNYPKTKDFRTEKDLQTEVVEVSTETPTEIQDKTVSDNSVADSLENLLSIETDQENEGLSTEALQVLSKIEKLEDELFTPGRLSQLKPFGKKGDNSASKIKYYLDELVIANLLKKVGDKYQLLESYNF